MHPILRSFAVSVSAAVLLITVSALVGPATYADDAPATAPAPRGVDDVVADLKSKDYAVQLAAAEESAQYGDDELTSPLVKLLGDEHFDLRKAAVEGLLARGSEKGRKTAATALAARLPKLVKMKEGEGELIMVVNALHDLAQPSTLKALLDDIDQDTSADVLAARTRAAANLPTKEVVDELIQLLSRQGRGRWQGAKRAVTDALEYATGERYGGDPDKWRAWWRDAERTFDLEAATARRAEDRDAQAKKAERRKGRGGGRER